MKPSLLPFARLRKLKEYQPVSGPAKKPLFGFDDGAQITNCALWHVLYEPMLVLVDLAKPVQNARIHIYPNQQNRAATLSVMLFDSIEIQNQKFALYKVVDAELNLAQWQQWYLKRIFGHSLRKGSNFMATYDFGIYRKLAALFSFPKQVRLVSIQNGQTVGHFPIDLCAVLDGFVVIGVRNSNKTIATLELGAVFYLGKAAADDYQQIYTLGKFHDNDNQGKKMEIDGLKIPAVISGYRKLKLQQRILFENQTLYVCRS